MIASNLLKTCHSENEIMLFIPLRTIKNPFVLNRKSRSLTSWTMKQSKYTLITKHQLAVTPNSINVITAGKNISLAEKNLLLSSLMMVKVLTFSLATLPTRNLLLMYRGIKCWIDLIHSTSQNLFQMARNN